MAISEEERLRQNLYNPPAGYPKDGDVSYVVFGEKGRVKVTIRILPATEEEVIQNRKNLEHALSMIMSSQYNEPVKMEVDWGRTLKKKQKEQQEHE